MRFPKSFRLFQRKPFAQKAVVTIQARQKQGLLHKLFTSTYRRFYRGIWFCLGWEGC